ncbi:MAG TPA: tRNA lysidine(34) synthetase TilS, partial [Nitrospiria bacterium]|nr:tRNA lysidine(34) synthetase TilS [Nitrospiria bacterium]
SRRPGDIIYPAGLKGHKKKLQDLFVDRKVPRSERDGMILLAAPGRVLWAPGFERDFQSKVSLSTRKTLKVMIQSRPPDGI